MGISVTVVDLVHFSRHPVVDAHFLGRDRCLVYLLYFRQRRLLLPPELGTLFQVQDGVPRVVVHNASGLRLPVWPDINANNRYTA